MKTDSSLVAPRQYPKPVVLLHWASALAIVGAFLFIWLREAFDGKPVRAALLFGHSQFGLLLLLLVLLRLWTRWRSTLPASSATLNVWQRRAAAFSHGLLYLLLLAQPLLGWALMSSRGLPVMPLGLFTLPALSATDPDLADQIGDVHEITAWVLLALAGVHAGAALWHHFVRRDDILAAMWPRPLRRPLSPISHTEGSKA